MSRRHLLWIVLPVVAGCQSALSAARPVPSQPVAVAEVVDWGAIPAPKDNPVTQAKVELGFRLWFEPRLSGNNRMSCATCHSSIHGFSNDDVNAVGVNGQHGTRNVPTVYDAANGGSFFWDGRAASLEAQSVGPIQNPIEMASTLDAAVSKLQAVTYYPRKFQDTFGTGVDARGIAMALASFERALRVRQTPYQRYLAGDKDALTAQQQQGLAIFASPRGRCVACHNGPTLTDGGFHNVGIDRGTDHGRSAVTGRDADEGAFKTPTLVNVAQSGPYMHDGSLKTLADVVAYYNRGGNDTVNQDPRVRPMGLSADEQAALVAFLQANTAPDNLKELGQLPGIH